MVAFNLMVAVCENMGIGKNGNLPWRLKTEMEYFTRMTTKTTDPKKKNVVLMGRKTWDSIPPKYKPLHNRINFVMSRSKPAVEFKSCDDVYLFKDLASVVQKLAETDFRGCYETVWVIGGTQIYNACLESKHFYRLYITNIMKSFDCDTFFPNVDVSSMKKIEEAGVPKEVQEENGVRFVYNVYENPNFET